MENKFKILIAAIAILFVGVIIWVIATTSTEEPPATKFEPPATMEYETNNIVEEKDGKIIYELDAEKMIVEAATQNAEFENINGKFYQAEGKFVEITAKRGNYNHQTGDVHVEGDVVVTDSEGAKLTGGSLDWLGKEEILIATGNVQISKDDMRGYGDRAEATNGLRHFKLKGNARILRGVKE